MSGSTMMQLMSYSMLFQVISGNLWCGYSPEWTSSYSRISFSPEHGYRGINNQTVKHQDEYTAVMKEEVTLTLTATVGGMLPPKPGDLMLLPSQVFGQMFVRLNGEVVPDSYLLVKEGQVSHKEMQLTLEQGDTVDLFTGHVTREKISRDAYASNRHVIPGGFLEDVVFCVLHQKYLTQ